MYLPRGDQEQAGLGGRLFSMLVLAGSRTKRMAIAVKSVILGVMQIFQVSFPVAA